MFQTVRLGRVLTLEMNILKDHPVIHEELDQKSFKFQELKIMKKFIRWFRLTNSNQLEYLIEGRRFKYTKLKSLLQLSYGTKGVKEVFRNSL